MPNGRCRMHRGKASKGTAAPNFKHGLYSNSLPARLAGRYEEALRDSELLSVRREAAIITAQVDEALARLETGETGKLWLELRELWRKMERAPEARRAAALERAGELIRRGATDTEAAREVREAILDKARVAESERKRLVEAHQMITIERMLALVGALAAAIAEEIPDREQRARILDRFDRALRPVAQIAASAE